MIEGNNTPATPAGEPLAIVGSPEPQAPAEVAAESTGAPTMTTPAPAAAPLKKIKVYLLDMSGKPHGEVARFEFDGTEHPQVIIWWKKAFLREGKTGIYRQASSMFIAWGEEPAK